LLLLSCAGRRGAGAQDRDRWCVGRDGAPAPSGRSRSV